MDRLHVGRFGVEHVRPEVAQGFSSFIARYFTKQFEYRTVVGMSNVCALALMKEANRLIGPLALILDKHSSRSVEQLDRLLTRRPAKQQARFEDF